jgi:hypothetical protein
MPLDAPAAASSALSSSAPAAAPPTAAPPLPSAAPPTASTASTPGFRPVTAEPELQSGEKLLVEAYAVMWLLAFGFVLVMVRRLRSTTERLDRLERALDAAARKREGEAPDLAPAARGGDA